MALVLMQGPAFRDGAGGESVITYRYDDGTLDVRSVTYSNSTQTPLQWRVTWTNQQGAPTTDTYTIPAGTSATTQNVQRNRYRMEAREGDIFPANWVAEFGGPV